MIGLGGLLWVVPPPICCPGFSFMGGVGGAGEGATTSIINYQYIKKLIVE